MLVSASPSLHVGAPACGFKDPAPDAKHASVAAAAPFQNKETVCSSPPHHLQVGAPCFHLLQSDPVVNHSIDAFVLTHEPKCRICTQASPRGDAQVVDL